VETCKLARCGHRGAHRGRLHPRFRSSLPTRRGLPAWARRTAAMAFSAVPCRRRGWYGDVFTQHELAAVPALLWRGSQRCHGPYRRGFVLLGAPNSAQRSHCHDNASIAAGLAPMTLDAFGAEATAVKRIAICENNCGEQNGVGGGAPSTVLEWEDELAGRDAALRPNKQGKEQRSMKTAGESSGAMALSRRMSVRTRHSWRSPVMWGQSQNG